MKYVKRFLSMICLVCLAVVSMAPARGVETNTTTKTASSDDSGGDSTGTSTGSDDDEGDDTGDDTGDDEGDTAEDASHQSNTEENSKSLKFNISYIYLEKILEENRDEADKDPNFEITFKPDGTNIKIKK